MKKLIATIALLTISVFIFTACSAEEINHCPFAEYEHVWESGREREWEDDIVAIAYYLFYHASIANRFEEMAEHFSEEKREYMIERVNALIYDIPNLTDREVQFNLAEVFAVLNDPITAINPPLGDIFPIIFSVFYGNFHVSNAPLEYEHLLHSKLVAINGIDVNEIISRFDRIIPQDSVYRLRQVMRQSSMNCDYRLEFLGITDGTGVAEFTLMDLNGGIATYIISAISLDEFGVRENVAIDRETLLLGSRPGETYWSEDFPEYNFVYFRLNDFHPPGGRITYLRNVLRRIDSFPQEEAVTRLVIDLRGNPGFGSQITQFNMFDETDRLETIYVLIDSVTSYVASIFAYMLRTTVDVENIIFMGEPTGSPEFAFSNVRRIPFNSQITNISRSHRTDVLQMQVASWFYNPANSTSTDIAIRPDYFIPLTIQDIITGHDPVLEFIKSRR